MNIEGVMHMHQNRNHVLSWLKKMSILGMAFLLSITLMGVFAPSALAEDGPGTISINGGKLIHSYQISYTKGPVDSQGSYVGSWAGAAPVSFSSEAGIPFYLHNADGELVATGYTDNNNEVKFENLPLGVYTVTIDADWMAEYHEVLYRTMNTGANADEQREACAQEYSVQVELTEDKKVIR